RVGSFFRGRPEPAEHVEEAIEAGLQTLLVAESERAAAEVDHRWRREPGARSVLATAGDALPGEDQVAREAAAQVRAWQDDLLSMVREEGADKRMTARILAFGVNGLGIALMVVVFASTGGLVRAESAAAGGTAGAGQTLREASCRARGVPRLAAAARVNRH